VRNIKVVPGISDHDIVTFDLNTYCQKKRNVKRKVYIRKKADLNGIKKALKNFAERFEREAITKSVEERWNDLEYRLQHIMNTFIPYRTTSSRHNLPWFNRSLKRLVKTKQRLYNKAKKCEKTSTQSIKDCQEYVYVSEYLTEAVANNPKIFWSYIKQVKQDDVGVADFEIDGLNISDGQSKAEILNKQFSSVFTEENLINLPEMGNNPTSEIPGLQISSKDVLKQLLSLKTNMASGPDDIPSWFLKENAYEIAPILANIFQASITEGVVPKRWKTANLVGI
jgi:hypothetical protein